MYRVMGIQLGTLLASAVRTRRRQTNVHIDLKPHSPILHVYYTLHITIYNKDCSSNGHAIGQY